jgi:hypothetical protein
MTSMKTRRRHRRHVALAFVTPRKFAPRLCHWVPSRPLLLSRRGRQTTRVGGRCRGKPLSEASNCNTLHMYRRWNALLKSFYNSKKGTYDISKVTDLADQLKFDLVHNSSLRIIQRVLWSMWLICKPIARYVSSCQYGISPEERVNLATSICGDLLRKIALDLLVSSGKLQIDGMATVHMVDPTRAGERAIQSSSRHVRTRL